MSVSPTLGNSGLLLLLPEARTYYLNGLPAKISIKRTFLNDELGRGRLARLHPTSR